MVKAVVFDLDGTLVDSREDLIAAVNFTRQSFYFPPLPNNIVMSFIGDGNKKLVERSIDGSEIDFEKAFKVFTEYYMAHIADNTTLYSGVLEVLEGLTRLQAKLAILSNKNELFSKTICDRLGITKCFSIIAGGDTYGSLKPDPKGLFRILKTLGCKKEYSWFVGDSHIDLQVARLGGIKKCFCSYGYGRKENEKDFGNS